MGIAMKTGLHGRNLPLAFVAALLLQGASVVWWASAKERDVFFITQRVTNLEVTATRSSEGQAQILERLARIEERLNAQVAILNRIEKQIGSVEP